MTQVVIAPAEVVQSAVVIGEGTGGLRGPAVAGVDVRDGATVVRLVGELDLYNADEIRTALRAVVEDGPERVVVDLSDVTFVDSTALGVLIEARTKLPNRRAFLLASPGLETRRALQVSGLDRHLAVHESLAEALAAPL
jgi:anti-sigma B factor antagonist